MFIIIHCLGMPFNGDTIENSSLGGSESAAYYLAKELSKKGHKVTLFTSSGDEGVFDGVNYLYAGQQSEQTPLGDRFHMYGSGTPSDVMIIQRHPQAFKFQWASKINLWWVHDLAIVRQKELINSQLWNVTGILTVSEYHKKQIVDVYGINPDIVFPIQNGVDLSLFEIPLTEFAQQDGEWISEDSGRMQLIGKDHATRIKLLYSSRPERGLDNLVEQGGIMERLAKIDSKYHLYVCCYENTTDAMRPYYDHLYDRIKKLPNATLLDHLTKQQLADVMRQCDAMVYPTPSVQSPEFREVSCITAMEAMAAGLPFISSSFGALSETCKDSGSILLELDKDGLPDIEMFVNAIVSDVKDLSLNSAQLNSAKKYDWPIACGMVINVIETLFKKNRTASGVLRTLIRNSDYYAAEHYCNPFKKDTELNFMKLNFVESTCINELTSQYSFAKNNTWEMHYQKYYEYEKDRGVTYGPESLDGNSRFEHVSMLIGNLPKGSKVLDYGCAHGHYTINLAKRFPSLVFIGVDITKSNIDKAEKWAKKEKLTNVSFINSFVNDRGLISSPTNTILEGSFNAVIAAEVMEHVQSAQHLTNFLMRLLVTGGQMIITTPFGPWEAQGFKDHWNWRAHVHHFEREDLHDMFSENKDFKVMVAACGYSKWSEPLGSYITTFSKTEKNINSKNIDFTRKINNVVPIQTVSACMIVHNAEETLKKCLDSIVDGVDEIILCIDENTNDRTEEVIKNYIIDQKGYWPVISYRTVKSPLEVGFDEARNESIKGASGDWILWVDDDEIFTGINNLFKYLHNNAYNGYAIKQHHFSMQPLGVMKTDIPCRLFRNHRGVLFFGVVHEHPEVELNKGVGHVQVIPDVEIAHSGYETEMIRRERFRRNLSLMERDRKKYPDRVLGRFLWLRDLSQMCQYDLEINGGVITDEMILRAKDGMSIWEDLIDDGHLRMLSDGMEFYSALAQILGNSFEFGFSMDSSKLNGGLHLNKSAPISSHFHSRQHLDKLLKAVVDDKVKDYDSKFF